MLDALPGTKFKQLNKNKNKKDHEQWRNVALQKFVLYNMINTQS